MKTHRLLNQDIDMFATDDSDAYMETGAFDDNWIVSACDLFRIVDMPDDSFDTEFTQQLEPQRPVRSGDFHPRLDVHHSQPQSGRWPIHR